MNFSKYKVITIYDKNMANILQDSDLDGINITFLSSSPLKALKGLIKLRGGKTAVIKSFYIKDPKLYEAVKKNSQRRTTRLPLLFNPVTIIIYNYVKNFILNVQYEYFLRKLKERRVTNTIVFNGSLSPMSILVIASKRLGIDCTYVESGFFPETLQVDNEGINGNSSLPQDKIFYNRIKINPRLECPQHLNKRKSKFKQKARDVWKTDYFFVPMQVPTDMQITELSPWIKDMKYFYNILLSIVNKNPSIRFLIKEHPSYKKSIQKKVKPHKNIKFANTIVTEKAIISSKAVVLINSTVGIEAILKNIPVIQLGISSYGIDGLVTRCYNENDLINALNNDDYSINNDLRDTYIRFVYNIFLIKRDKSACINILNRAIRQDEYSQYIKYIGG